MKKILLLFIVVLFFNGTSGLYAQDIFSGYEHLFTTPRNYIAFKSDAPLKIDGRLDEGSWDKASWSDYFIDIEGDKKEKPALKTRFKLLWDSQYVYIGVELEEPKIWANIKEHDAVIYYDNDIEVFLDPDGDTHNYFEVELNAHNKVFDLFMSKPYRNGGAALLNWDVKGLRSGVAIMGSLNQAKDTDKSWFAEIAIPFRSVSLGNWVQVPKDGAAWRINFSRVEWDVEVIGGRYVKQLDKVTKRSLPEHNWVWSPQGIVNMHFPERWGYLYFSTKKAGSTAMEMQVPVGEQLKKYLWLIYYKQQGYFRQHNKYTGMLAELNMPASIEIPGITGKLSLEATTRQFTATIKSAPGNEGWQINHEGKISKY